MADAADIGGLKVEDFSPYLNTGFEVQLPDGSSVTATLAEAAANGTAPPAAQGLKGRDGRALKARDGGGFTLQFVTPQNIIPGQGVIRSSIRSSARWRFPWCRTGRCRSRATATTRCSDKA